MRAFLGLSGIPDLTNAAGGSIISNIGGWFLVASALIADYTGMAVVVNSIWNQTVLSLGGEA